jgi:serine/threonine protein kinase
MDSPQSSTVVAGYRIDGTLGEGGMGTVYRATQLSLERVVALKVLTAELSSDPGFRERFRREGLLQAALDHPHIVTVYEAGEANERLFLAMRMVEGPTLKDLIQRHELDDRRALRLLTQVAEALDAAHAKGLIHRDVKPQNVLVGVGDHAYLADFGLTKGSDDAAMTETGQFVGTIDYISPEQARGERATAASDVYALTAVLCECLTGQVPYVKAT